MNRFSIQKQIDQISNYKSREEVTSRLNQLQGECQKSGFSILDSSQLAWKYATGVDSGYTLEEMIEEMKGVDRLYKETQYDTNLQEGMRLIANQFKYEFQFMTWSQVWDVVREFAPLAIKAKTMDTEDFRF
jgi:predicted lipoprotein